MATEDIETQDETTEDVETRQAETATEAAATEADETQGKSAQELAAEAERLRRQLKETNRKAAADRLRLAEIDREKQEKEDAKLSETARLKKQLKAEEDARRAAEARAEKLQGDLINRRIDQEIERAAIGQFEYPQAASKLVDRSRIEYDPESDKVTGIKDALERLIKEYPGMATAKRGGGSPAAMTVRRPGAGAGAGVPEGAPSLLDQWVKTGNYDQM